MTLGELLQELRNHVLRDRSSAVDAAASEGALFTDVALVNYLRDAENRFARKTNCLRDSITMEVTRVPLVAGQQDYAISPKICTIYRAMLDGKIDLGRVNSAAIFGGHPQLSPESPRYIPGSEGAPEVYYTDQDTNHLGVHPIPTSQDAGKVIRLQVSRLPLSPLSVQNLGATPEIPEDYHMSLVDWAAYKALSNNDTDFNGDPANIAIVMARNNVFRKRFEDAIEQAKSDVKKMSTQNVRWKTGTRW